ncbi:glycerol-3-phosphate dehydrogenase/oxidase [Aquibacillus koreensis]|uniref:Glycerol-3-phosphate dehydrogenase n=1 Tax=Aquibacillus koreensis TaxID=279446 RepID=A0A9X3WL14_9BACI|nr:glycerol-3-phosphate dehydrogenase/oxidase [Aquibacillus koreensis]MCT2537308.1 glycerol-3-phosphate dehydrogenase/oxidase [Aquibacillus koreensis]MDC3421655.1 glycerol-3-phosphate dehydrogenase/oxidase [Aquibacillus koreensis]
MNFSNLYRHQTYEALTDEPLDVLIIGGGITGAGIALDGASRGLKVGIVDMQDFAAGTSSRSTKLVHGGLRYLQQLEVGVVAEVGKERAIVYENGPHVTRPEWMLLPFYKKGNFGPLTANVGLRMYDFLAKVKKQERRTMLSRKEALEKEPLLKREQLIGAGYYVEYKTDDARLTIEVLKKAVEFGARALNYTKVEELIYEDEMVTGVSLEDQITGQQYQVFAKKIINAAGPWVDTMRELDGSKQGKKLLLTKGVHLVFDRSIFPLNQAIYYDNKDGRMIFAIPRGNKTYVGTTDTTYDGDIAHPTMTVEDRDYLIEAIQYKFPTVAISAEDVESSWAGLRPLIEEEGKDPDEISRKDEIFISDSGLISIAGGKLTGYRKMAENVIDLITKQLKNEVGILYSRSETKNIPLAGGDVGGAEGFAAFKLKYIYKGNAIGIDPVDAEELIDRYGSNVAKVYERYTDLKNEALEAELDPLVFAQLRYAIESECIYKPIDFFNRRTSGLYFNVDWVKQHRHAVTTYMAKLFNYTNEERAYYGREVQVLMEEAVSPQVEE